MIQSWNNIIEETKGVRHGIAVLGLRGAGKSAFLYVLGRFNMAYDWGDWNIGIYSEAFLKYLSQKTAELDNWQKTDPMDLPDNKPLFTLTKRRRPLPEGERVRELFNCAVQWASEEEIMDVIMPDEVHVASFDVAGEIIEHALCPKPSAIPDNLHKNINTFRTLLCSSEAFVFILDASSVTDRAHNSCLPREEWFWQNVLEHLRKLDTGQPESIHRPIAVVLNKADYFLDGTISGASHDELKIAQLIDSIAYQDRNEHHALLKATRVERALAARQFVERFYPHLYRYFAEDPNGTIVRTAEFFAVSCWGKSPDPPSRVGHNIHPIAVHEPLCWLCNQIDELHAKRSHRSRRKTLLFVVIGVMCGLCLVAVLLLISYIIALFVSQ